MVYYEKIDISTQTDLAISNNSKECMICHYWLFSYGFQFQDHVCNDCHDLTMLSVDISDIAIVFMKMLIIAKLFITLANLKHIIY